MPADQVDVRHAGDSALLIEVPDASQVHALAAWLGDQAYAEQLIEIVPGARTVLVVTAPDLIARVEASLTELPNLAVAAPPGRRMELPVRYDGDDLDDVCERLSLSRADFISAHSGVEHRVEFFGFSPGLAFCAGLPERLRLPRRDSPRTKVPADSLAIANQFSIVYPASSPGGWHLIGSYLGPSLWDLNAEPPNRLALGDRVVFTEQESDR